MSPMITALVDTFNHERYIEQALVSVLEQDFPSSELEILVVDDGSTDRTPEIVRKFAPRVRLLRKKNGGQASAFNVGIRESRGETVAFLDGDDWFAPGKLAAVASAFEANPGIAAVGHGYYECREETKEVRICAPIKSETIRLDTAESASRAFRAWDFLRTSALAARRKVLEKLAPIPEVLVFCADAFLAPACMVQGVYILDQPLLYYRVHANNLCTFDDAGNQTKLRRRSEMHEALFELLEPMLVRLGVRRDSARALLYPYLIDLMRFKLRVFGGSRLTTLRTETRAFVSERRNLSPGRGLFKYACVSAATLLLPPRQFYSVRDRYARWNSGRLREQIVRGR
jgi:glycosyltransferase involved in cell wall biosynthesis